MGIRASGITMNTEWRCGWSIVFLAVILGLGAAANKQSRGQDRTVSGQETALAAKLFDEITEGPGKEPDADQWDRRLQRNSQCLFFREYGGVRWYVDPLAL